MNKLVTQKIPERASPGHPRIERRSKIVLTSFCGVLISSMLLCAAQAEIKYSLTIIPMVREWNGYPVAINNGGRVVGFYTWRDYSSHSFKYKDGVLNDLGTINGAGNMVTSINNYGQMVGFFENSSNPPRGYLHSPSGNITYLGGIDGNNTFRPLQINDCGVIVGLSGGDAAVYRNGQMRKIGTFQGHPFSRASSINNRGQILATYQNEKGANRTVIVYSGGEMQDIGIPSGSEGARGVNMNDNGVIVGESNVGYERKYFLYSGGKFHDLGLTARLGSTLYFYAVNNCGRIVGTVIDYGAGSYAILCEGGNLQNLNDLIDSKAGVNLLEATDINDSGQICAYGFSPSGATVFLLTPVK